MLGARTPHEQVDVKGLTDLDRQQRSVQATGLAANHQLTTMPVHVTEVQTGVLDRAQPAAGHQLQDREVACRGSG